MLRQKTYHAAMLQAQTGMHTKDWHAAASLCWAVSPASPHCRNRVRTERRFYREKLTSAEQTKQERQDALRVMAESRLMSRMTALERKQSVRRAEAKTQSKLDHWRLEKVKEVKHQLLLYDCRRQNTIAHPLEDTGAGSNWTTGAQRRVGR